VSSIAYLLFADSDKGYQVRLIKTSIFIMLAVIATDEIIMFPPYEIHAIIVVLACKRIMVGRGFIESARPGV